MHTEPHSSEELPNKLYRSKLEDLYYSKKKGVGKYLEETKTQMTRMTK